MVKIQHNITALNTSRNLVMKNNAASKSLEKLASGFKINRAGDDAAGLAISEKMRAQITGLNMAAKNAQDGISLIQTAEGALNEVDAILQRARELAVQATNDTNTDEDRAKLNQELRSIFDEIDNIGQTTEFNTMKLFTDASTPILAPPTFEISINVDDQGTSYDSIANSTSTDAKTALAKRIHDTILPYAVKAVQDLYGDLTMDKTDPYELDVTFVREGKGGSVAYVISGVYSNGDSYPVTLAVDLDDVLSSSPLWIDVDRVITHEMVHAVMSASGINWNNTPKWFKEGSAEYVAGANERVRTSLNLAAGGYSNSYENATDAQKTTAIKKVLNSITASSSSSDFYSAGYLATGYLDKLIQQKDPTKTIANFMKDLSDGVSFDEAIKTYTGLTNQTAFLNDFKGANGVQYLKDLDLFNPANINKTGSPLEGKTINGTTYGVGDKDFIPDSGGPGVQQTIFTYDWLPSTGGSGTSGTPYPTNLGGGGGFPPVMQSTSGEGFTLHIGANEDQAISIERIELSQAALDIQDVDISTQTTADEAITKIDDAIQKVSESRSKYGAYQNRLEHTITNLQNTAENLTSAESRIRDTDMAAEMMEFTKNNILMQAAQSMLSQANQQPQGVLQLLS